MPTFTAIAFENLLQPEVRDSSSPKNRHPLKPLPKDDKPPQAAARRPSHIFISPALYATPKSTPIPTSPLSVSPSPYVVNRKRWEVRDPENRFDGFEVREPEYQLDGFEVREGEDAQPVGEEGSLVSPSSPAGDGGQVGEWVGKASDGEVGDGCDGGEVLDGEKRTDDDFLGAVTDLDDAASVASSCDTNDGVCLQRGAWKHAAISSQNEFFDAPDEFLSDSSASSPSMSSNLEVDLRAIRLSLFEEIERRKKAEAALQNMHKRWQIVVHKLSQMGLSFPLPSDAGNLQLELNSVEQFCQEVAVARFVSEAVGRGLGKAEAEASAQEVIVSKRREISRLQDKLQYYEAMNREMCQRNKEIKEMSRQQRKSRKMRQKWIWGCIGLSVALGASALAFSYLPETGKQLFLPTEASSTSSNTREFGELHQ